ncbi:ABC transporter permease [Halosquirtibacter laminarini]|uniref:ABC transporter permease n=1 Tax=Halosquirtibacter laminarini TaxID=3374600 RepID=A0AC61NEF0_9BACT|nr:ABC transporter permease [Prolixibacteraceae bacterium]
MNLSFYIAKRYLFSKKKAKVINIISFISIIGLAIGTFAMVVTISVFNGFDTFIQSRFSSFDPPLKVSPIQGKVFSMDTIDFAQIQNIRGVDGIARTLEDNALLRYGKHQTIATVKGVDSLFLQKSGVSGRMIDGVASLYKSNRYGVILGGEVASNLRVGFKFAKPLICYFPKQSNHFSINITQSFKQQLAYPMGCFSIQSEIDSKYVLVPLEMSQKLTSRKNNRVSNLEIYVNKGADIDRIQSEVKAIVGPDFYVKNRYEQHDTYFKVMKGEKWAIFLILAFILFVASFNLIGSITMLMIDKKEDINIVKSMGANEETIRRIFLYEGWMITTIGTAVGLITALIACYIQQEYGIVKLQGAGTFIINAYPVRLIFSDVVIICCTVISLGIMASWVPIRFLKLDQLKSNNDS